VPSRRGRRSPAAIAVSNALTPIMRDRYPNLTRFIAIDSEEDKARFEALGMRAVVNRSTPRGLDLAAAVLRAWGVDEGKVGAWMQRQQERSLGPESTPRIPGGMSSGPGITPGGGSFRSARS
jgi:CPA2 family monovalent cation:H+ antiporter-2